MKTKLQLRPDSQFYSDYKVLLILFFLFSTVLSYAQCPTWYPDNDGDGFGDPEPTTTQISCTALTGYVLNRLDCNDAFVNPAIRQSLGGGGLSSGATVTTKIDVGADGLPVVLYLNYTPTNPLNSVAVKKFDGTNWVALGTDPISTFYDMSFPNMVLDQNGVPYISFTDYDTGGSPNNRLTVLKYNTLTSTWELVGSRRFSSELFNSTRIEMKFNSNNVLYVAYLDDASNVNVMEFNSGTNAWQDVGAPAFAPAASELSLDFDNADVPYLSFASGNDLKATVMKFDGTTWVDVGPPSFSDFDVESPKISINSANIPYVAYYDYGLNEVVVKRFTGGAAWDNVGNTPVESGSGTSVSIIIDLLDVPVVAYQDNSNTITLKILDASDNWVSLSSTVNQGLRLSMAIGPDNIPYVSFGNLPDGDRATAQSVTPQVIIPTAPTVTTAAATICSGDNTTLSITAGTLNDGTRWVWYANACGTGTPVGVITGTPTPLSVSPTTTTTYYARGEGNCSTSTGPCASVTVNVDQPPPVLGSKSVQYFTGATASINSAAGLPAYTYQWQLNSGSGVFNTITNVGIHSGTTSAGLTINPVSPALNGFVYRNRIINGTCTVVDGAATIYVTNMPASTNTCVGGNSLFAVLTSNGSMTYQWQEDSGSGFVDISNSGVYTGATTHELSITGATLAMHNYKFRVRITDPQGNPVISDGLATLSIHTPATITVQPTASQDLCEGSTLTLGVTATGTNVSYQWRKDGTDIPSATTTNYTVGSVGTTDAATYTVVVTSAGVCTPAAVTSNNAVVDVHTPATITVQPTASQDLCVGSALNLSVTATGTNVSYQWRKDGSDIPSATTTSYSVASVAATDAATYTVVVTSAGVCTPAAVTSNNAVFDVHTPATITVQPTASQDLCEGSALTLGVTATGTDLSYQWRKDGADIPSATTTSYSVASVAATDAATYTVVVTSAGVCTPAAVTSNNAVVDVHTPATITVQPTASQDLCVSSALNLSVTATGTNVSYQWRKDGSDIPSATTTSYSVASVGTTDAATYTVVVTSAGVCTPATVTSNNAVVAVHTPATITVQPAPSQDLCAGSALTLGVTAAGTSISYQWRKDGIDLAGANTNSYSVGSVATTHAGTYTVVVRSVGVCAPSTVVSSNAVLSVRQGPVISIQPQNATVCAGTNTTFSVSASGINLLYQWQVNNGSGFTDLTNGSSYSGATSATLQIATVSANMDGHQFRVLVSVAGCGASISSSNAVLSTNAMQGITMQPTDRVLCDGESTSFAVSSGTGNFTYRWQVDQGIGFITLSNNGLYTGVNSSVLTITSAITNMSGYRFRAIALGNCGDEPSNAASLIVNSLPEASAGPDVTMPSGSSVVLEGTAIGDAPLRYLWTPISDVTQASELRPTVSPFSDTEYTLSVTNTHDCVATDAVMVFVTGERALVIPNAFSPNNDAINDTWEIENLDPATSISVNIFNRYGQMVFTSSSNPISWDGKYQGNSLPWGTYYYVVEMQNPNKTMSGWVVILN